MLLLLTQQGAMASHLNNVINAFIEANVAYMEPNSLDLIDDTFEEVAVRFESDVLSVLIFVMVIRLWLTMESCKNLGIICAPLFGDVVL